MPSFTYFRLLRENSGDLVAALEHAARTIDYLAAQVSVGAMRAGPRTDRAAKIYVEGLDVPAPANALEDSPNG